MRELKRRLSNTRIAGLGLEGHALHWLIGRKWYEPEKVRYFVDVVWSRLPVMDTIGLVAEDVEALEMVAKDARRAAELVRTLHVHAAGDEGASATAAEVFGLLRSLAAAFLRVYFRARLRACRATL